MFSVPRFQVHTKIVSTTTSPRLQGTELILGAEKGWTCCVPVPESIRKGSELSEAPSTDAGDVLPSILHSFLTLFLRKAVCFFCSLFPLCAGQELCHRFSKKLSECAFCQSEIVWWVNFSPFCSFSSLWKLTNGEENEKEKNKPSITGCWENSFYLYPGTFSDM